MDNLSIVKDRVQRALREIFDSVDISDDGFSVEYGSTICWVKCHEITDPGARQDIIKRDLSLTFIHFYAPIAMYVPRSTAMFEWVATEGQTSAPYGASYAAKREDGLYNVVYKYTIAGDCVDPSEVKNAALAVCVLTEGLIEPFTVTYGGVSWADS